MLFGSFIEIEIGIAIEIEMIGRLDMKSWLYTASPYGQTEFDPDPDSDFDPDEYKNPTKVSSGRGRRMFTYFWDTTLRAR